MRPAGSVSSRLRTTARRATLLVLAGLLAPALASAQKAPPSPEEVLGHALGERFTDVAGVNRYLEALAEGSPLVSIEPYGESVEGRPLIHAVIASPDHRDRLDEILEANAELVRPGTSPGRASAIASSNPAVVYFSYGVHGNESSSSEAAIWTAWDLARGAPGLAGVLDSLVVVIDPVANPDGRARYVQWYRGARGERPDPSPHAREHHEPWPGGRYNHYLFDLNRDWSWATQPETRARLAAWERWNPQVHVDFHEMSYTSTYFFFPATEPINPLYPDHILAWGRRFGEANARAFDERGWLYYTAEDFDLFYPGYGDSWPSLVGAIGMTYEQAGHARAGLAVERPDGSILTLADRAHRHRVAGEATLRAAAAGRAALLADFARFHREVDRGLADVLLVPGAGSGRAEALVGALLRQGIVVERADRGFAADADPHPGWSGRGRFPAGTYRVRARQPRGRLAVTLLRPEVVLDAEFSYDIAAWSLPYAFGVEAHSTRGGAAGAGWTRLARPPEPRLGTGGDGGYGYLVPPVVAATAPLAAFLEEGGRALVLPDTVRAAGQRLVPGTVLLPAGRNPDLDRQVAEAGLAPWAIPTAGGLTDEGPDLGSGEARSLELPNIALLGGDGVRPTSFGAHWFFLERDAALPFDAVDPADVAGLDLGAYDVVVAPAAGDGLLDALGTGGLESLERWVRAGGTLVAVAGSATALGDSLFGVEVREEEPVAEEADLEPGERLERALRKRAERERERWREGVPGTVLEIELDPRHPLAFGASADGMSARMFVLSTGTAFEPDTTFESPGFFPADLEATSGPISAGSLERLRRGAWMVERGLGKGKVVLFADDPLFRRFWYGNFRPYLNAILFVPAF
ncbi:MAG: M14 family metallopeptidase [Gemmatimonadota bacterium]|nr:M14 family metallopeptidase [Gemmatimonadota bacterium]